MTYAMPIPQNIDDSYTHGTSSAYSSLVGTESEPVSVLTVPKEDIFDFIDEYRYPPLDEVRQALIESNLHSTQKVNEIVEATAKLPGYERNSRSSK